MNHPQKQLQRQVPLDNLEIAFKSYSDFDLKKSYLLFKAISHTTLVKIGPPLVKSALRLHLPVRTLVKHTLFQQFCAGQDLTSSSALVKKLASFGVKSVLDYSAEALEDASDQDFSAAEVCRTIKFAAENPDMPFAVFKVSAVARHGLLEKISQKEALTAAEQEEYAVAKKRIEGIFATAHTLKVPLQVDAEETWIQDAIDAMVLEMMQKYNRKQPLVFNTAQMYRVDRLDYLKKLLEQGQRQGFFVGIKLVRGAYMEKERWRAAQQGYVSPIHKDKAATDTAYNAAIELMLTHIETAALYLGTHNEASVKKTTELMAKKAIERGDLRCYFSQLYGMSENLTYNLAHAGYNAAKLMPYGPVAKVLPYLFRRAEENTSIQGQTGRELKLIAAELQRRAKSRS